MGTKTELGVGNTWRSLIGHDELRRTDGEYRYVAAIAELALLIGVERNHFNGLRAREIAGDLGRAESSGVLRNRLVILAGSECVDAAEERLKPLRSVYISGKVGNPDNK